MVGRCLALIVSVCAHYAWLSHTDEVALPQVSGGSLASPVAMSISMVTVKPMRTPAPEKTVEQSEPVKKRLLTKNVVATNKTPEPEPVLQQEPQSEAAVEPPLEKPVTEIAAEASSIERAETPPGLESLPVIKDAAFRHRPAPPIYPKLALRKRQQGEALIQALVNSEGDTVEVKLVRSSGYGLLDRSALKAVEGWQFESARVDGLAITAWVEVPVAFNINR